MANLRLEEGRRFGASHPSPVRELPDLAPLENARQFVEDITIESAENQTLRRDITQGGCDRWAKVIHPYSLPESPGGWDTTRWQQFLAPRVQGGGLNVVWRFAAVLSPDTGPPCSTIKTGKLGP